VSVNSLVALVGTGVFAHNVHKVLSAGGCSLGYSVDEFRTMDYLKKPVFKAAEIPIEMRDATAKFVVAISHPEHCEAAVQRLQQQGVPPEKIIPLTDDHVIPILDLIFSEFGSTAAEFFESYQCRSVFDLERHFFGDGWVRAQAALDPAKQTLAFCFYGRGGGFRRHIRGLIPRLRERFNLLALMDEKLPNEGFDIPELFMGPDTARDLESVGLPDVDLSLTAHFISCSPDDQAKVNFLHTSFDFILEPDWIVDRLETADPHYIFTSTRATYEWMIDMVGRRPLKNRICLIPGGYTRLDENLQHAEVYTGPVDSLIYAPTLSLNAVAHHELTYSAPAAAEILKAMRQEFPEQKTVFRPHPNDLQLLRGGRDDELAQPFIAALAVCESEDGYQLDEAQTFYMDSYNRAAVMISDTSSTAYTYALTTCRPVVFFSPHDDKVRRIFADDSVFIRDRNRVGRVVGSVSEMVTAIAEMNADLAGWQERIAAYRAEVCFNLGRTEEYFVENIDFILEGKQHPDWFYLNWGSSS